MHQLLTESWFLGNVNKRILEANISNKILLNSKIKKKLFHLKVTNILLNTRTTDPKEYKKLVSRKANNIASNIVENDEIFEYPSSLIYLLNLVHNTLRHYSKLTPESLENEDNDDRSLSSNSKGHQNSNSKEEFKSLTKKIVELLNRIRHTTSKLLELEEYIQERISERGKQINLKYNLG